MIALLRGCRKNVPGIIQVQFLSIIGRSHQGGLVLWCCSGSFRLSRVVILSSRCCETVAKTCALFLLFDRILGVAEDWVATILCLPSDNEDYSIM